MRYFLVLFVCFQSHMVTGGLSEEINNYTTLTPQDANEDVSTDSQLITETSTEGVTEITTTDTTEAQPFSDETTDFTKLPENTDFPTSTSFSTSEQVEERSTFLAPEAQTGDLEITTILDEESASGTVTTEKAKISQHLENIDTSFAEQLSPTERSSRKISTVLYSDSNATTSYSYDQTTKSLDLTSLVDFDPENNSRIPESTTLAKAESEITSPSNRIEMSFKTVEVCSFGMVCVSVSSSCECASSRETKEGNLTQYGGEQSHSKPQNTLIGKENEDKEENLPYAYRKLFNLSPSEQTGSVATLAFTPSVEIVEWFQIYESKFKRFFASRLAVAWDKLNNETVRFPNAQRNILYVAPSPFQTGNAMVVSFLVQSPFGEDFLRAEDVLDCVRGEWVELETQLQLNVSYMKIGFPFDALQQNSCKVLGNLDEGDVKMLLLGMLVLSTCSLLAAIVAITLQCRTRRSTFIDLSAIRRLPYGHPAAVLVRSPGDGTIGGKDLASDQQCKEEELDRDHWMASHSQRGDDAKDGGSSVEKTVMVEMQVPKKDDNSETPF